MPVTRNLLYASWEHWCRWQRDQCDVIDEGVDAEMEIRLRAGDRIGADGGGNWMGCHLLVCALTTIISGGMPPCTRGPSPHHSSLEGSVVCHSSRLE